MTKIFETDLLKNSEPLTWGVERRLEFIEFRLFWEGKINRGDLIKAFNISVPQASLDLNKYQKLAPKNLAYDKSAKYYYATLEFTPILISPSGEQYLSQINAGTLGFISADKSFLRFSPPWDTVPIPGRKIDPCTLRDVLRAIRDHKAIEILYQSMNRPEPIYRWIAPHALAFDGFRWHTRAYCYIHKNFRDFVFARILEIGKQRESNIDPKEDKDWQEFIIFKLGPHPELKPGPRRVIEEDYGMKEGHVEIKVRKALAFYFLKKLGLEESQAKSPEEKQIILLNREKITKELFDIVH